MGDEQKEKQKSFLTKKKRMKFWSTITLMFFINFLALPSIAKIVDWDIAQTNVIVSEEETHSSSTSIVVYEKALPKVLNVHDFLKFFESDFQGKKFQLTNDDFHSGPLLTLFSPPPEA